MKARNAYQEKLFAKLNAINKEIKVVRAKANEAKKKMNEEMAFLKEKQMVMRQRARELRTAGDSAWTDVKSASDLAWKELSKGLAAARKRFK